MEEFKIKKSKESRRLIKQKEREKREDKDKLNVSKSVKDPSSVESMTNNNGNTAAVNQENKVKIIDDDIEIVLKVAKQTHYF